jgi:hypothetical protein
MNKAEVSLRAPNEGWRQWVSCAGRTSSTGLIALVAACSSGGGGSSPPPAPPPASPDAQAMAAKLSTDMARSLTRMASLEAGAVIVLNPGMPLAPGMSIAPDHSAGAPPNRFTYSGSYDGNGNGHAETTLNGSVTFANDPTDLFTGFNGAQGDASADIDILGVMHVYHGDVAYSLGMTEHRVTGSGTFTNPMTGTTTMLTLDQAHPLEIKIADGTANARPNACAHSFNGKALVNVTGPAGTLASQWHFAYDRPTVAVSQATYTDTTGRATALPDTEVNVGCADGGSINDWNGRYRIQWACLPQEFGEFRVTITIKNATTVSILDDGDPPEEAYDAALIGTSPRVVRGFFTAGPAGGRYREDFNWTLNLDGSGFSQTSRYVYFEGQQAGRGGICAARATRL